MSIAAGYAARPARLAMTLCRLAALIGTGCAVQPASAALPGDGRCVAGAGPFVTVRVEGLHGARGRLKLELYPANDADFLRDDGDLLRENHKSESPSRLRRRRRRAACSTSAV
jgi:hypothetical protein